MRSFQSHLSTDLKGPYPQTLSGLFLINGVKKSRNWRCVNLNKGKSRGTKG